MLFDHLGAEKAKKQTEAYKEHKESIRKTNFKAFLEMNDMERTIKEQHEKIQEYQSFFSKLAALTPARHVPPPVFG